MPDPLTHYAPPRSDARRPPDVPEPFTRDPHQVTCPTCLPAALKQLARQTTEPCHADGQGPCVADCCPIRGHRAPTSCPARHALPPLEEASGA